MLIQNKRYSTHEKFSNSFEDRRAQVTRNMGGNWELRLAPDDSLPKNKSLSPRTTGT